MSLRDYAREYSTAELSGGVELSPPAEWIQLPDGGDVSFKDGRGDSQSFSDLSAGSGFRIHVREIVSASQKVRVGTGEGPMPMPGATGPQGAGGDGALVVRGVVIANIADLANFTVANNGITYVEGDVLLAANQTTGAECGPYVVGVVDTGVAPLTRHPDFAAAEDIVNGMTVQVSYEGTLFAGSTWKALCTGAKVWGTDDPLFYPKNVHARITLVAGTKTLGATQGLFLKSTTESDVQISRATANTSTLTIEYGAPTASRTAGKSGTAALVTQAEVGAGTLNNADISTIDVLVTNW